MNEMATINSTMEEKRDITTVTMEIKMLHRQVKGLVLAHAVEIGRRLAEAKELLPYGEWGKWLKTEVGFSPDTASRLIKAFEEYGAKQLSLFGAEVSIESAALRNLSITKALQLLVIPEEERETFVADNDVENMSTRDLQKLIKEREEAQKALEEAEAQAEQWVQTAKKASDNLDQEREKNKKLQEEIEELKNRPVEVAVQEPDEETLKKAVDEALSEAKAKYENEQQKLKAKLEGIEKKRDKLEQDLKKAEEAKKKAEETAAAASESQANTEKVIAEAAAKKSAEDLKAIEEEKEQLKKETESLRKQLAMSDAGVAEFRALYSATQDMLNKLKDCLASISNPETKEKLRVATEKMLQVFGDVVRQI